MQAYKSLYKFRGECEVFTWLAAIGKHTYFKYLKMKRLHLLALRSDREELLEHAGVVTVPGSAFGDMGEGYLRLVFANSDENLKEAVRRIADYVARAYPGLK